MPKLTDTQLVILTAATRRADGAVLPLPKSLKIKGGAVTKTLESLRKKGLLDERPAARDKTAWREGEAGERMTLAITDNGLDAIGASPAQDTETQPKSVESASKNGSDRIGRKGARAKPKTTAKATTARSSTKQAQLIRLLKRKNGATINELVAAIGWQAHSIRGAISGTLKKKLGLTVISTPVEGRGRVYKA